MSSAHGTLIAMVSATRYRSSNHRNGLAGRHRVVGHRPSHPSILCHFVRPRVEAALQPLALHLANSMFLGDYLTSEGQGGNEDRAMIADAGFVIEGATEQTFPTPVTSW